jgi:hypothetical protein
MKFRNPEHALRWAYEQINGPYTPDHGDAALLLGLCERVLSPLHMAYVRVQFGREANGFDLLARHLAANFGVGVHSRRGIEQVIRAYCGEKIGLREIRKSFGSGMLKAASLRNQGYDMLDVIHAQAMDTLHTEMEERGMKEQS